MSIDNVSGSDKSWWGSKQSAANPNQSPRRPLVELVWDSSSKIMRELSTGQIVNVLGGQAVKIGVNDYQTVREAAELKRPPTISDGFISSRITGSAYWVQYYKVYP